jgi:hypothetical protein
MCRRFRYKKPPLRHFIYISDTKLDMLFEQIDPALRRRISAEVKVDLKLASLTLRQTDSQPAARIAKLRMVERYIDTHHQVGTIPAPGHEYFRGSMPMQWGWLTHGYDFDNNPPRLGLDTVFFRGHQASQVVVLAGSRRHVLGEQPAAEDSRLSAHSATPNIFAVIGEHISRNPQLGEYWRELRELPAPAGSEDGMAAHDPPEVGLREAAQLKLRGPVQHLEFLALPLVQGEEVELDIDGWPGLHVRETVHAVLATPLYVAMGGNQVARTRAE